MWASGESVNHIVFTCRQVLALAKIMVPFMGFTIFHRLLELMNKKKEMMETLRAIP